MAASYRRFSWALLVSSVVCSSRSAAGEIDRAPIFYGKAPVNNPISRLQTALDAGKSSLAFDDRLGYLPGVLDLLRIPRSSQVLVFSKTSMQRNRISPHAPRALYFSDDMYIGYCQRGKVLEVTAVDPQLGSVFYTLDQTKVVRPKFVRQDDVCLLCHGSSQNQGFPGHLLRSVYADEEGMPILSSGTYRIDQTSPFERRWGGWYVSGTHGKMPHLGNLIVHGRRQPEEIDNKPNMNVTDLGRYFPTAGYLGPHSDIVALLVLEHQAEMHNRITRAGFLTRIAVHDEAELNKGLGKPAGTLSELTRRRIKSACEPLLKYMLFSGEPRLPDKVRGASEFAREFARHGPRDSQGRSLRDLDLETRVFKYPCSYLVYSEAFAALPAEACDYVMERLWDVLGAQQGSDDLDQLSNADRRAIRDILLATKGDLPAYWTAR